MLQIQGGGTSNIYSGPTSVNDGALVLFKSIGVNSIPGGGLVIGDGIGAASSSQVIVRNSHQIADTASVTLNSDGLLDLATFNTTETIANLSGISGSVITLGPNSTLTFGTAANTTFAGSVLGEGTMTKQGTGTVTLNGALAIGTVNANSGTLNLNSDTNGAVVNANATSTVNVGVSQTLSALNIADGGVVSIVSAGFGPTLAGDDAGAFAAFSASSSADQQGVVSSVSGSQTPLAVPEPGSTGLLMMGILGLLRRTRRQKR